MKAQLSLEFIIILSIAMVILTFSIYSYYSNTQNINKSSFYLQASAICRQITNSINNVISNGDGASIAITLPNNLQGNDYTATVYSISKLVEISFDSEALHCNLATVNVTNSTNNYTFRLNIGKNTVRNSDGRVIVN